MPSEGIAHRVETGEMYPVVRLNGVLDPHAAPGVRSTLLAVLADQPEALVVDVAAVELAEAGAAAVLRDVARINADWPAAHIALIADRDAELWHSTGLPVWPDTASALDELGTPDPGLRLRADLDPAIGAARRARELVTEGCGRWECPELAGPACIVITEMVNNVVAHAHTPMTVFIALHADTMSVAVRDDSVTAPRFTGGPVSPTSYGGRGLLLIDSVSSRWGHLDLPGGKVVWALLQDGRDEAQPAPGVIHRAGMTDPAPG
ncbi:MAG TPA: ATP-binding protein [Actinoplanes sp.]|nr:ATP-binding protein [Actinoplanes sp.]